MDLYRTNDGAYLLVKDGESKLFQTAVDAMVFAVSKWEIVTRDFIWATTEMDKNGHNVAHFGIFGSFIFSERKDIRTFDESA